MPTLCPHRRRIHFLVGTCPDELSPKSGSRGRVRLVPYTEAYGTGFEDMDRRVPHTGKLRALTGWAPRYRLADILRETIQEARDEAARSGQLVAP